MWDDGTDRDVTEPVGIDRITVRGFKSIRALDGFRLEPLTVLIGPNGSGKSNLLSVFRMLSAIAQGRFQLFVGDEDGPDSCLFGGRKKTSSIYTTVVFGRGRCRYEVRVDLVGNTLLIGSEDLVSVEQHLEKPISAREPLSSSAVSYRPSGHYESYIYNQSSLNSFLTSLLSSMKSWKIFHFQNTMHESPLRSLWDVNDNRFLRSNGENIAPFIRRIRLHYPEQYRSIVDAIRLVMPTFEDFAYHTEATGRVELEWFHRSVGRDKPLGPRQLSDGMLRYICLATLFNQPECLQPNPIIVDEPELGLHPFALVLLAEMLKCAADGRQIIVSTQSADLVSEVSAEDVVTVNHRGGESYFERLNGDHLSEWLEEYTLGDLWRMNVIGSRGG